MKLELLQEDQHIVRTYYVNLYKEGMGYGGPEEGGWWYDEGYPVKPDDFLCDWNTKFFKSILDKTYDTEEEAYDQCRQLSPTLRYYNKGFPDKTSVLSTGIYVLKVQDHKPKEYPEVKPHYE